MTGDGIAVERIDGVAQGIVELFAGRHGSCDRNRALPCGVGALPTPLIRAAGHKGHFALGPRVERRKVCGRRATIAHESINVRSHGAAGDAGSTSKLLGTHHVVSSAMQHYRLSDVELLHRSASILDRNVSTTRVTILALVEHLPPYRAAARRGRRSGAASMPPPGPSVAAFGFSAGLAPSHSGGALSGGHVPESTQLRRLSRAFPCSNAFNRCSPGTRASPSRRIPTIWH